MFVKDIVMGVRWMAKRKYGNKKSVRVLNGETVEFDSKKEARRFDELYLLLRAKKISKLVHQPYYLLHDTQKHNGKTYQKVSYSPDFKYEQDGKTIVEDVKSEATAKDKTYVVKVKWFLSLYGDDLIFKEV